MSLILVVFAVLALLLISEFWWRRRFGGNEFSRKFIHITVGSFVAFWPFFLTWPEIIALSIAFIIVVTVSRRLRLFQAIHSVQRPTMGEQFFAVSVGGIALVTHAKGVYAVALLQMALADGLAAIIGSRFGSKTQYRVFGSTKSIVGTATFFVVSLALLIGYNQITGADLSPLFIVGLAGAASLIENIGVYGLDNLLVPLLIAGALTIV